MSLGLVYLIVAVVAVGCSFIDRNKAKSNLSMVAAIVMIAAVAYAGINYSWFHLLGLVGITLIGLNVFSFLAMMQKQKAEEKDRIDRIFNVDDDDLDD
ncbi:MAG: hypothetical protein KBS66_00375 [Eubacterium sp.]|nr:hypothetical protein [Candidatus Colimonas fimequi]